MELLVCLSLLGYCFSLTRFSKLPIEYGPFFVVSSCTVLLYIFAYLHILEVGADTILIVGGLFFLAIPVILYSDKQNVWLKYFTPGFVISSLFLAVFLYLAHNVHFSGFDEFTHWGPHSKFVFINNGFITASDTTINKSYPLGGALFQYLFFRLSGYSEGTAYVAQCLLTMAPLSILIYQFQWCSWKKAFIAYATTLFFLLFLKIQIGPVDTLYMDGIVGIYFGMLLVSYLASKKNTSSILYLIPVIAAMALFKPKLYPLILMLSLILLCDQFIFGKKNKLPKIIAIILLPLTSFVTTYSWHQYLQKIHTPLARQLHLTASQIVHTFLAPEGSTPHAIIINYLNWLPHDLVFLIPVIVFGFISFFAYPDRTQKKVLIMMNAALLLGFAAFCFGLLLMYLFAFVPFEAIHHFSMGRYLNIFSLCWMLVALYFLFDATRHLQYRFDAILERSLIFLVCVGFSGLITMHYMHQRNYYHRLYSVWNLRQPTIQIADAVKKVAGPHTKIFTVWQDAAGFERGMLVYELTPRTPNLGCLAFGKPYTAGDVWTCDVSPKNFLHQISSFNYLLLAFTDKNFWSHYGAVLPHNPKPLIVYSICHGNQFRTFGTPGCTMKKYSAYLFKIIDKNGHITLENANA